jgi:hypothetical protein
MIAAMGMALKQSVKFFHNLTENFLLPKSKSVYIRHKTHKVCLFQLISDFLARERSFKDI